MNVTHAELAKILGVARSHITRLKQDGSLRPRADGKFDLAEGVQQYIAFLKAGKLSAVVSDRRAKLLAQQERRLKLENDEREGRLASVEDMQIAANETALLTRSLMEAIASRCAAELATMSEPAAIRAYLLVEIRRALAAAAERIEAWARGISKG